jgi:hypothetical protein
MTAPTQSGLIQLALRFYPAGYPISTDDSSLDRHPYQRTPEYARWSEAWDKALDWKEWNTLMKELHCAFESYADSTQPRVAACRKCCVYVENSLPDGTRHIIRAATAASVLAPLYITYCTTTTVVGGRRQECILSFDPPEEARRHAEKLSSLVERILGHRPFPLQFAQVSLPDLRVSHTFGQEATLLDAFFDNHLESLF